MVTFEITVDSEGFQKLQERLRDLRPLLRKVATYFEGEVRTTLEKGEGRKTDWPDLSERTKKQKIQKKGTAYPILTFTGRLRNSIASDVVDNTARVFAGVQYGVYHQLGTSKMPARPFMEIIPEDVDTIVELFVNYLKNGR